MFQTAMLIDSSSFDDGNLARGDPLAQSEQAGGDFGRDRTVMHNGSSVAMIESESRACDKPNVG